MRKNRGLFLFGVLLLLFFYVLLEFRPGIYFGLERYFYDMRDWMKTEFEVERKEIVIVDIDEKTLKELGRFQSWPRYYFGKAIDEVASGNSTVIGIDVIFSEPDSMSGCYRDVFKNRMNVILSSVLSGIDSSRMKTIADSTLSAFSFDSYLSSSIQKAGKVVLASYLTPDSTDTPASGFESYFLSFPPPKRAPKFVGMVTPIRQFMGASAGIGIINSIQDEDGVQRKSSVFFNYRGRTIPSFDFSVAREAAGAYFFRGKRLIIGGKHIQLEDRNFLWINYQGDFKTFEYVSFVDLIEGRISNDIFKNKIVLFGSSAPALSDDSQTPFHRRLPSIEVHANIIHNLLYSDSIRKASRLYTIIFVAIAVFLVMWFSSKLPPYISPILTIVVLGGYFLFAFLQYLTYLVDYEMARPILAIAFSFGIGLTYRISLLEKEKRHIRELFSRYVPEEIIKEIILSPNFSLEGEKRQISVLISDIRGFTTRAELESPEEVVNELNAYFEEMATIVFQYGGMIDKYMGDGIMCLFGAPIFHPAHADRALSSAIVMQQRLRHINIEKKKQGKAPIHIGIAINSGDAIIGNIGSSHRADYTAIGDVINTASRLEPLNKEYKTEILITEATRRKLKGKYKIQSVGKVLLKGKSESTTIHAVNTN